MHKQRVGGGGYVQNNKEVDNNWIAGVLLQEKKEREVMYWSQCSQGRQFS